MSSSDMAMFAGVEFNSSCGGGLALVNVKWFTPRKQEVFWPPYKSQKLYRRALQFGEDPDVANNWKLFPISRCFFECDNLDKAQKKLKLCEVTSDLQTDEEVACKRKKIAPRRFIEDSDEDNQQQSTLPRPPRITIIANDNSELSSEHEVEEIRTPIVSTHYPITLHSKDNIYEKYQYTCSPTSRESASQNLTLQSSRFSRVVERPPSHVLKSTSTNLISESKSIEEVILEKLIRVEEQNGQILERQNKILQHLESSTSGQHLHNSTSVFRSVPVDFPVTLPIHSDLEIDCLEQYLSDETKLFQLAAYLKSLGGKDVIGKTNNALKYLLSNELATQYSFFGKRGQKRAFANLHLKEALVRAVKSTGQFTEQEIQNAIKTWLKHAPQRFAREQKSNHQDSIG